MNSTLEKTGRNIIKNLLEQCSKEQFSMFKRMYCHKNINASIEEAAELIKSDRIDLAISQIERTIEKNKPND